MAKKFLRYQMELEGTHENDLTDDLVKKLNGEYEARVGIYAHVFGEVCEINAHSKRDTIVLCGCIVASTKKECNQLYGALKIEAKKAFGNCKKTSDICLAYGDKLF